MPEVNLDRMEVEEVGANPQRLAEAIHRQLGLTTGAVPVGAVARALDIVEIRKDRLAEIEGALLIVGNRDLGSILVNSSSGRRRSRFTIGHELSHFLNLFHVGIDPTGFRCRRTDMKAWDLQSHDRHRRQEAEANAFAIELLAPRDRVARFVEDEADIGQILALSDEFDISREAAGRRYAELHIEAIAVVFSYCGTFQYASRSRDCPPLALRRGLPLPTLPCTTGPSQISDQEEALLEDWFEVTTSGTVLVQTLHQQNAFAMSLIRLLDPSNGEEFEEGDGPFPGFDRR